MLHFDDLSLLTVDEEEIHPGLIKRTIEVIAGIKGDTITSQDVVGDPRKRGWGRGGGGAQGQPAPPDQLARPWGEKYKV